MIYHSDMAIDAKDLIQLSGDFKIGGIFYLQKGTEFFTCCIFEEELKDDKRKSELQQLTKQYMKEGRLFLSRNFPWKSVMGY